MKLLFASDSFKGSLTSGETAALLDRAAHTVFKNVETANVPVADGGEGTVDAVVEAMNGERITTQVSGPLGQLVPAVYGVIGGKKAVIEMAAASGLPLVPEELRNPLYTTSYGTGELIRDALDRGFRDISIAIGGSATNDGGIGCMRALGVKFLDENGNELTGKGSDLIHIRNVDASGLDARARKTTFTVMCDVTNPLCGAEGATYTFGPQKGGTKEILDALEAGMKNYRDVIVDTFSVNPDEIQGSGAAGGLGTALLVFLHAELKSGVDTVLDLIDFDNRLRGVNLVVTGEGRSDWQSCYGKVMQGVGNRCRRAGIPAVGLSGSLGRGAEMLYNEGILSLMTTVDAPMELSEAMERANDLYYSAAVRMFRMIRTGMKIAGETVAR